MSGVKNGTDIVDVLTTISGPTIRELIQPFAPKSLDQIAQEHRQQIENSVSQTDPRRKQVHG
jgi:hypothetical protein